MKYKLNLNFIVNENSKSQDLIFHSFRPLPRKFPTTLHKISNHLHLDLLRESSEHLTHCELLYSWPWNVKWLSGLSGFWSVEQNDGYLVLISKQFVFMTWWYSDFVQLTKNINVQKKLAVNWVTFYPYRVYFSSGIR